jgi:hypothetical protein
MTRPRIRATNSRDKETADFARDAQAALDSIPESKIVHMTDVYAEPLVVKFDHEPIAVRVLRVRLDATPEEPIDVSSHVSFVYRSGAIEISEIAWLSLGERYRFALEVVG